MTDKKRPFPHSTKPFQNRICLGTVSNTDTGVSDTDTGDELAEQDYVRAPHYFEPMCFPFLFSMDLLYSIFPKSFDSLFTGASVQRRGCQSVTRCRVSRPGKAFGLPRCF